MNGIINTLDKIRLLRGIAMINIEDLTDDEVMLLKMAFKSVEDTIEIMTNHHYCGVDLCNTLFNLKEKLGIGDII